MPERMDGVNEKTRRAKDSDGACLSQLVVDCSFNLSQSLFQKLHVLRLRLQAPIPSDARVGIKLVVFAPHFRIQPAEGAVTLVVTAAIPSFDAKKTLHQVNGNVEHHRCGPVRKRCRIERSEKSLVMVSLTKMVCFRRHRQRGPRQVFRAKVPTWSRIDSVSEEPLRERAGTD